jgi:hypothetical protein
MIGAFYALSLKAATINPSSIYCWLAGGFTLFYTIFRAYFF